MGEIGVAKDQTFNRTAFDRWQAFCCSRQGTLTMFLWAAAEATFWPIIPDGLLFPMAIGRQTKYWQLLGAAILGSTLGGITIYLFAYFMPDTALSVLPHLPVVQTFMIEKAGQSLNEQGAMAFWTQPWSGVSFKIFAIEAGARGIDPLRALSLSVAARGLRMLVSSGIPRLLARRFPKFFRDYWLYILGAYLLMFGYVWVVTQLIG